MKKKYEVHFDNYKSRGVNDKTCVGCTMKKGCHTRNCFEIIMFEEGILLEKLHLPYESNFTKLAKEIFNSDNVKLDYLSGSLHGEQILKFNIEKN